MDIDSQNDTSTEEKFKQNFIRDYIQDRYNTPYLYLVYGEENVRFWLSQPDVKKQIIESTKAIDKEEELRITQINNFKTAANDVVAKGLKGEKLTNHQVQLAMWILGGERAFIEAKAKAKGERAAEQSTSRREPLKILKINGDS